MKKDRSKRLPLPDQKVLLEAFRYEADTGLLWWKVKKANRKMDRSCGTLNHNGYMYVRFENQLYTLHRIIWKILTGREPMHIDHVNGCRIDNRCSNLREVTRNENNRSIGLTSANTSGYVGVRYSQRDKSWMAYIKTEKKRISIGYFKDKREAVEAYNKKAIELHGKFAIRKVHHNIQMLSKEFGGQHDNRNDNTG